MINGSPRATRARSLVETLTVQSARVIRDASVTVSLLGRTWDADGIVADAAISTASRSAIDALALTVHDFHAV